MEQSSHAPVSLPEGFLANLIPLLDDDTVSALILHGSYARHEATAFSDVDLVRILREHPESKQEKQFLWYEGYLLNLSSRPLSIYKEWVTQPQEAVFRVSTIRDAQILLDKERAFHAFQQEVCRSWNWESLQQKANEYASHLMVELSEVILRMLGALHTHHAAMILERILLHILPDITKAIGVQRGVIATGNRYLQQVQEAVGYTSRWTQLYLQTAAAPSSDSFPLSLEARGIAALHLYQETIQLMRPALLPAHQTTIDILLEKVSALLNKPIA